MSGTPAPIAGLKGDVLVEGDAEWESGRRVFNGMIDRRPACIVRPVDAHDVALALAYARERGLPLAIRGGGHNVGGTAVADAGMVIDHSRLRSVSVDPHRLTAEVQPGATWRDFDAATQAVGLATTGGLISSTGVAGFTLGGGIGWLVRKHGLACDNLIEADVVTADGVRVRAAADGDADLLWALRGGGGNFGVVTRFRFRLHRLGDVTAGLLAYPRPQAEDVLRHWRDFLLEAPDDLTSIAALMTTPDGHPAIGIAVCHAGSLEDGMADLESLRVFGNPVVDEIRPMSYVALQASLDATAPYGTRNYWKSDFMRELTDDAIRILVDGARRMASPLSQIHIHQLGGAMAVEPAGGSAFAHRGSGFIYNLIGTWRDAADDADQIGWARSVFDSLRPYSAGAAYANFLADYGADPAAAAYGSALPRLRALKRRYDPDNVFRLNLNIAPG